MSGSGLTITEQLDQIRETVAASQNSASAQAAAIGSQLVSALALLADLSRFTALPPISPLRSGPAILPPPSPPLAARGLFSFAPVDRGLSIAGIAAFPPPPVISADLTVTLQWLAGQDPNDLVLFVAAVPMMVGGITGRLETAEGGAADLTIVKAADGTALSAGTALHTGVFDADGTPATNQTLTLAASLATRALSVGDCVGIQTTGAWTTSTGNLTIVLKS